MSWVSYVYIELFLKWYILEVILFKQNSFAHLIYFSILIFVLTWDRYKADLLSGYTFYIYEYLKIIR